MVCGYSGHGPIMLHFATIKDQLKGTELYYYFIIISFSKLISALGGGIWTVILGRVVMNIVQIHDSYGSK